MIRTVNGNEIDYRTLEQKLEEAVNSQSMTVNPVKIRCSQEGNNLAITVEHQEENPPDSEKIISIIDQVIAQEEIIDEALIYLAYSAESLYNSNSDENENQENKNTEQNNLNNQENNSEIEVINSPKTGLNLNNNIPLQPSKSTKNFSVGFLSFISGLIFLSIIGLIYYFTRPCVIGECKLIPQVKTQIDENLQSINQNTKIGNLQEIQANISKSSQQLTTIPRWSKYYNEAQNLQQKAQEKNQNINEILQIFELETNAENMAKNLPLSQDEWTRVKGFWQEAILILKNNQDEELKTFINSKLITYQNKIQNVNEKIAREEQAETLLKKASILATNIEKKQTEVKSLVDLKNIEKDWVSAITNIENIPAGTKPFQEKDTLLNNYLDKLLAIRDKIKIEESANNLIKKIKETTNLAKKSEQENQWTRAISYWENALKLLDNSPKNTFLTKEFEQLKQQTKTQLDTAKIQLRLAVTKENIKTDLKRICNTQDTICTFNITEDLIKVYLTDKYLEKVAKISSQSHIEKQKQLEEHINQVEKNYQYISSKYRKPLEIYNPQQKLIIRY